MLNAETKRHIDAARDVLVGVAPNPMTQVDQITYALIYKFMDDMDQSAIKLGGEPSFFVGDLEPYAYSKLMDSRLGNQERMNLYAEALTRFAEAKQLPELFRTIFRAAFLPYRSPETLGLFLKEINFFDYSHPEELGNAYEYLLSIMSAQGDAGQFRTPRHIIDFMVDVLDPSKTDRVLDPACGTGGFLVSSYNHILEKHDGKNDPTSQEQTLTPDERRKLMENFEGYDIDPSMVRIAQVNMYLHLFKNPKIYQYDSLTSEERWNDKFDVILANPPFMSPKGGIRPHNRFGIDSNRSEVLFVDFIMAHLRPKGRAAVIVPEGVVFQSGTAHRSLRETLLARGLYAVVSLRAGVFLPYSGVKTSILLIDEEVAQAHKEILFINVVDDGYSHGSSKRAVAESDLPAALSSIQAWRRSEPLSGALSIAVPKQEIVEEGNFSLVPERYSTNDAGKNSEWALVPLGAICALHRGVTFSKADEVAAGKMVLTASNLSLDGSLDLGSIKHVRDGLDFKSSQLLRRDDIFICMASGSQSHVGKVSFIEGDTEFYFGGFMGAVRADPDKCLPKYLYYLLRNPQFGSYLERAISGANIRNLNWRILSEFRIPLPPLDVQTRLVAELDGLAATIEELKQQILTVSEKSTLVVTDLWR